MNYLGTPSKEYIEKLNDFIPDFSEHNKESAEAFESLYRGAPYRMPMTIGATIRYVLLDPRYNLKNVTFYEYINNPDLMFELGAEFDNFRRNYIPRDDLMGPPQAGEGYTLRVDFQNFYEAQWIGSPVYYPENNVPVATPVLNDDNKNMLFDKGIPDPFTGSIKKGIDYYEYFLEKAKTYELNGHMVKEIYPSGLGTDGPMTIACDLRGTTEFCIDLMEDTEYALKLLDFITEATIIRIKALKKYMGLPEIETKGIEFADDSIALLSTDTYKELILPFHKRYYSALTNGEGSNSIHLCGDATRFFKTIRDELNVKDFDTGFPVRHGELANELGPDVVINGGPHIGFLTRATIEEVRTETKRIIDEVRPHTKLFVMREANNLAPFTPLENLLEMYKTTLEYGKY